MCVDRIQGVNADRYLEFIQRLVALFLYFVLHCTEVHRPFDNRGVARGNEVRHRKREEGTGIFPREKKHKHTRSISSLHQEYSNCTADKRRAMCQYYNPNHCEELTHNYLISINQSVLHLWSCLMSWFKASCRGVCSFSARKKNNASRKDCCGWVGGSVDVNCEPEEIADYLPVYPALNG